MAPQSALLDRVLPRREFNEMSVLGVLSLLPLNEFKLSKVA